MLLLPAIMLAYRSRFEETAVALRRAIGDVFETRTAVRRIANERREVREAWAGRHWVQEEILVNCKLQPNQDERFHAIG